MSEASLPVCIELTIGYSHGPLGHELLKHVFYGLFLDNTLDPVWFTPFSNFKLFVDQFLSLHVAICMIQKREKLNAQEAVALMVRSAVSCTLFAQSARNMK